MYMWHQLRDNSECKEQRVLYPYSYRIPRELMPNSFHLLIAIVQGRKLDNMIISGTRLKPWAILLRAELTNPSVAGLLAVSHNGPLRLVPELAPQNME
jgi:hypothetical protein